MHSVAEDADELVENTQVQQPSRQQVAPFIFKRALDQSFDLLSGQERPLDSQADELEPSLNQYPIAAQIVVALYPQAAA